MVTFSIDVSPLNSDVTVSQSNVTSFKLEQFPKGLDPIEVGLHKIVAEVRPLQPEKAYSPMLVTLLGIVTEVRPSQSWKA